MLGTTFISFMPTEVSLSKISFIFMWFRDGIAIITVSILFSLHTSSNFSKSPKTGIPHMFVPILLGSSSRIPIGLYFFSLFLIISLSIVSPVYPAPIINVLFPSFLYPLITSRYILLDALRNRTRGNEIKKSTAGIERGIYEFVVSADKKFTV